MALEDSVEESLTEAEESIRLVEAGAGGNAYSPASQTAALLRAARGDTAGAAQAICAAVEHEARVGYRLGLATDIAVAVIVLAGDPDGHHAAATLSGAISGPVLGHFPSFIGGTHQDYERSLEHAATGLGQDAFAHAERHGAEMTLDEIVQFAIGQLAALANNSPKPATTEQ